VVLKLLDALIQVVLNLVLVLKALIQLWLLLTLLPMHQQLMQLKLLNQCMRQQLKLQLVLVDLVDLVQIQHLDLKLMCKLLPVLAPIKRLPNTLHNKLLHQDLLLLLLPF